jgi:hypothetical protein
VTNSQKDEAKVAEQLLDRITKYEKELAEWEEVQQSRSNVITADPLLVRPPSDPSEPLREALRKPRDGETQIMATLVKIECEVKNITFILQIPSGLLRLRTRSFAEVAIVTYAPDVEGDISCGPRKPVNTVVICYVPSADKRLKSDGVLKSVEFVPADFKLKPDRS